MPQWYSGVKSKDAIKKTLSREKPTDDVTSHQWSAKHQDQVLPKESSTDAEIASCVAVVGLASILE